MVKIYLHFSIFTLFLKNRDLMSKIRRSKVTDYAALTPLKYCFFKETISRETIP